MAEQIRYEKKMAGWLIRVYSAPDGDGTFRIRTHARHAQPTHAQLETHESNVPEGQVEARVRARANEMIERLRTLHGDT